jgi:hypothetical protein
MYYLVDGIYHVWSTLAKTISHTKKKEKHDAFGKGARSL